jgi:hypothetical protein
LQIKTKIVRCHTADSKPVKQEVNRRVILPPLVFPVQGNVDKTAPRSSVVGTKGVEPEENRENAEVGNIGGR